MDTPRAAVGWVESLTKQPPPSPDASLCTYLRDGRVLCMLANALSETNEVRVRPRDRFRTYHALESVSLFLRWARDRALIDDNAMFTSAQLIDEQDEVACQDHPYQYQYHHNDHQYQYQYRISRTYSDRPRHGDSTHCIKDDMYHVTPASNQSELGSTDSIVTITAITAAAIVVSSCEAITFTTSNRLIR
ncbi:hypothetical protein DYB35_012123 [Aphanomyces astaci]|uniref:Calponin-homology (CH) domain-containing protein n=2 Tax=Aphanomyces astaci TaxID=112090 RepID=A0A397AJZ2_APHAT|nr:hypothetical protein DYB36_006495 [Aphanomyces astaci]RHY56938.1 hypothetical protein DYB38_010977 [Aphanomyces astaci]RHZ00568.1 hypothetical protein DYB35_012123 [Aphanomyces astaci]